MTEGTAFCGLTLCSSSCASVSAALGARMFVKSKSNLRSPAASPNERMMETTSAARILRAGDYDKENHLVRLWHPDPGMEEWIDPYNPYEGGETDDGADVRPTETTSD